MAISVSEPTAMWQGSVGSGVNITSGSFAATNGGLLVAMMSVKDSASAAVSNSTASDSFGFVWTLRQHLGWVNNAGVEYVAIHTAPITSGQTITVSLNCTQGTGGSIRQTGAVFMVTGQHATTPIGASSTGTNTLQNADLAVYTSTANNSRGFYCWADDNDRSGVSSSDCTIDNIDAGPGSYGAGGGYKTIDTPTSGTAVTMNIQNGGGGVVMQWASQEILPAAAGGATPLLGQACL